MKNIETILRKKFNNIIQESVNSHQLFAKNPSADFTRNRKLPLNDVVKFFLGMNGGSLAKELYDYFGYSTKTATASAFIQQNDKLLPEFYEFLMYNFTDRISKRLSFCGYPLLACDGSTINIRTDKNDKDTYIKNQSTNNGYNAVHLNALYDLNNHIYTNVCLQKGIGSETKALLHMIKTGTFDPKTIFIADRGYENYNLFANIEKLGLHYLVRIKDTDSNGILKRYNLPNNEEFDIHIHPILTKKQTNKVKNSDKDYVFVPSTSQFDFVDLHDNLYYEMNIRIVRIEIAPGKYECIATNLDDVQFSKTIIKKLYFKRWGIETSFRELKYNIGLVNLHSKKLESIYKEIYAKITMFNYCMAIINAIAIIKRTTIYVHQANISLAILFCKQSFRLNNNSIRVVELIQNNTLPIRDDRSFKRKLVPKGVVCFQYRVA